MKEVDVSDEMAFDREEWKDMLHRPHINWDNDNKNGRQLFKVKEPISSHVLLCPKELSPS
jgi:hypothetical protein